MCVCMVVWPTGRGSLPCAKHGLGWPHIPNPCPSHPHPLLSSRARFLQCQRLLTAARLDCAVGTGLVTSLTSVLFRRHWMLDTDIGSDSALLAAAVEVGTSTCTLCWNLFCTRARASCSCSCSCACVESMPVVVLSPIPLPPLPPPPPLPPWSGGHER